MKRNTYILILILIGLITISCNEDDDDINPNDNTVMGCTDINAANYNPNATIDDGSCIILGCTDEDAINYNPDATDDNGSCEYSNASILNGTWNIISLEYATQIDLEIFQQDLSGEAYDAGTWHFNSEEYIYSMDLDFETEAFTISIPLVGEYDVPSFPVENSSDGEWVLINNDNVLVTTDSNTNLESSYEIISLTDETAIISGVIPFSQDIAGMPIDLDIDVEMILEKQ
jgi:hypothetical protein